nr:immunoglobulin heavy chain junction region [Mus musculus]MBK4186302.1 immunoglobulin heavy chain junction region [Mus musculus]MBK4186303.1 immunoglobulin heavy chain junction region [Mus musculus]MBK4186305.1 immunoglobulin heavy chain junction region [Mus musculus]MBK4186306.1 immunoglobulin heavy chain junction region [Mus musculus]
CARKDYDYDGFAYW